MDWDCVCMEVNEDVLPCSVYVSAVVQ